MTNIQIIEKAKEAHGVKEEVDTYQGWKRCGHQVRKGQKALFQAMIWKPLSHKEDGKTVQDVDLDGNAKMILVKAYFFGESQVEG